MKDKDIMQGTSRICGVVVTYNRKALLEECLTALLNQTRPLDEIIVIDNASTDGTEDLVKARFSGITYVKLAENIGGAGGFHEGMELAFEKGYDWIWMMDDDSIAMADALEQLTNCPMLVADKVYALVSAVLKRDGSIARVTRRLFDAKKLQETAIGAEEYEKDYFQVDTASFVGFLVSRKAIDEVGLPLKHFFIYYDDTEYSLRIGKRGTIVTVPGSKIIHGEGGEGSDKSTQRLEPPDWKRYYGIRNRIYIYKRYGPPGFAFYKRVLGHTYSDIRGTLLLRHSRFRNIQMILCGVVDGLRGKLGKNTRFLPD